MNKIHWIAVDWGTSHVRIWAMDSENKPVTMITGEQGMGKITPNLYEAVLISHLDGLFNAAPSPLPVIICGMAGARQGWKEAPYIPLPHRPIGPMVRVETKDHRLDVRIHAGMAQENPADVMRGEEIQIAGLLSKQPDYNGLICLPGTHTKWANVEKGMVRSFKTVMTGELFSLLRDHSVLRHSMENDGIKLCEEAFLDAFHLSYGNPADLTHNLFALRAGSLLKDLAPHQAKSRLSGLLIGAEIAGIAIEDGDPTIPFIGDEALCSFYKLALNAIDIKCDIFDPEVMTLSGLTQAYHSYKQDHEG